MQIFFSLKKLQPQYCETYRFIQRFQLAVLNLGGESYSKNYFTRTWFSVFLLLLTGWIQTN